MDKVKRAERMIVMMRVLCARPNQIIPYSTFCGDVPAGQVLRQRGRGHD